MPSRKKVFDLNGVTEGQEKNKAGNNQSHREAAANRGSQEKNKTRIYSSSGTGIYRRDFIRGLSAGVAAACFPFAPLGLTSAASVCLPGMDSILPDGYPDRSSDFDVLPGFWNPPNGYGPVPIYLWTGDKLSRERLKWQLDQLEKGSIQGVTVYYHHTHMKADPVINKNFKGQFGRTDPGDPPVFSSEWWKIWRWFSGECAKRNMGVGFLDYTFNPVHSGYWPDEIRVLPGFKNYHGRLQILRDAKLKAGEVYDKTINNDVIALFAYPIYGNRIDVLKAIDLLVLEKDGKMQWKAPADNDWQIFKSVATTDMAYLLHPDHGKEWINRFFQIFENHMDKDGRKGMNYFFQDELGEPALNPQNSWSEDFPEHFMVKKGYDILPYLPALIKDIGIKTSKVRLDYWDVVMDLVEERFYKPIFNWHSKRDLIYSCDNWGRGLKPTAYGDYFRVHRWFTAPGNDAPGRGESFIQTKVSSSIANIYQRPRVWMEAFHSMGWDTRPDELTEQIDRHYLFGANLFNLASLYYTLHGSWWEFAPPCFHFRMPYWPHFKYLMKYTERLSYLLSQGHHVADVAIVYPVSPIQVNSDHQPDMAFDAGKVLFNAGIDFTFIDHQSLAQAVVGDGKLHVAGLNLPVLVLADLPAVRHTTLTMALNHYRSGGIVIGLGNLPEASDRLGSGDPELNQFVRELFGTTAADIDNETALSPQRNMEGGLGVYVNNTSEMISLLNNVILRDFISPSGKGKVLHRRVGFRDVYMVMDAPAGEECFFRSKGKVEIWDAWTGTTRDIPVKHQTENGTVLRIPISPPRSCLIVFTPGEPELISKEIKTEINSKILFFSNIWECELVPTMNNCWGDFRLPATDEMIGAEAREFSYIPSEKKTNFWVLPEDIDNAWSIVRNTYGPQMYKLQVNSNIDFRNLLFAVRENDPLNKKIIQVAGQELSWDPYWFSWRWGVLDQPGSQGYHGLKAKLSDLFIILNDGGHQVFRTALTTERKAEAEVIIEGIKPECILIDGNILDSDRISLSRGTHSVLIAYKDVPDGEFSYGNHPIDSRARSAVAFVLAGNPRRQKSYPLAMKWYRMQGLLPFDFYAGKSMTGYYRFQAPPGFKGMEIKTFGRSEAWVEGNRAELNLKTHGNKDRRMEYHLTLDKSYDLPVWINIMVHHNAGYYGGSAFDGPVKIITGKGHIHSGDWSKIGVLKHYSGGIRYKQLFGLSNKQAKKHIILDLGNVIASCEVKVNSKSAGVLLNHPFTIDISNLVQPGPNNLEVLVYNTLSNHYQTTPSPYKGNPSSGLIGPAKIIITDPGWS